MRIKTQVCFSATNLPHYQNLKTQHIKIITRMCQMTLQDSSDHFYPPTGHVWPWDFVQPWDLVQAWYYCPYFMKIDTETQFQSTNNKPLMIWSKVGYANCSTATPRRWDPLDYFYRRQSTSEHLTFLLSLHKQTMIWTFGIHSITFTIPNWDNKHNS